MIATKSEFARLTQRSAGRVSQWIAAGRIGGAALVETPSGEQIDVEEALRQLGRTLDVPQQVAQQVPVIAEEEEQDAAPAPRGLVGSDDQRRLLKAKADQAESTARQKRLELLAQNGQWCRIAEVEAAWQRNLGDLVARIEAALPELAELLAGEPDAKAAIVRTRQWWRALRGRLAGDAAAQEAARPEAVDMPELADADA